MEVTYEEAANFMEVDRFSISKDELKKKFRELSFKYHPDTSSIKNAQELFIKLQNAYDKLKDEVPFKKKNQDFYFGRSNKNNDKFFEEAFNFGNDYNDFKNAYNKFFKQYNDKFEHDLDPYYDKWKTTSSGNHYFIIDEVCFIVYKKKEDDKYHIQIKIKKYGEEVIMDIKKQSFCDLTGAQYYIKHTLINNLFSNIKLKI